SIQTGRKHGMILLDDSLFNLWRQGLVEEEEVMFKSRKPTDLRERIENAKKGIFEDEEEGEEEEGENPRGQPLGGVTRGPPGRRGFGRPDRLAGRPAGPVRGT